MLRMNLKKEVAKKSHFLLDILHGKFRSPPLKKKKFRGI